MNHKTFFNGSKWLVAAAFGLLATTQVQADCTYDRLLGTEDLGMGVMLTWSTAQETDNSQFIVEKSTDGVNFEGIGTVNGAGNSAAQKDYNFLDLAANKGANFYRLKQIDFDGSSSLTDVVKQGKATTNVMMVVNMSSETTAKSFEVTLDALVEAELFCTLKDARGNVVKQSKEPLINGLNTIAIDLSDQRVGVYRLVMTLGEEEESLVIRKVADDMETKPVMASGRKASGRN